MTTMTFRKEEVLGLLDALEGQWTDGLTSEELAIHDRLMSRFSRALDRLNTQQKEAV